MCTVIHSWICRRQVMVDWSRTVDKHFDWLLHCKRLFSSLCVEWYAWLPRDYYQKYLRYLLCWTIVTLLMRDVINMYICTLLISHCKKLKTGKPQYTFLKIQNLNSPLLKPYQIHFKLKSFKQVWQIQWRNYSCLLEL